MFNLSWNIVSTTCFNITVFFVKDWEQGGQSLFQCQDVWSPVLSCKSSVQAHFSNSYVARISWSLGAFCSDFPSLPPKAQQKAKKKKEKRNPIVYFPLRMFTLRFLRYQCLQTSIFLVGRGKEQCAEIQSSTRVIGTLSKKSYSSFPPTPKHTLKRK